jgi:hypothetical protein
VRAETLAAAIDAGRTTLERTPDASWPGARAGGQPARSGGEGVHASHMQVREQLIALEVPAEDL